MPILYSLVARGTVVLAEFSAAAGNASSIARRILEKFPEGGDTRASYSQVWNQSGFLGCRGFCCIWGMVLFKMMILLLGDDVVV